MVRVFDFEKRVERNFVAVVSKDGVCLGEIEHGHFASPKREGQSKTRRVGPGGDPHFARQLDEILHTKTVEEFDRRDVVGASKGSFEGDGPMKATVIVFGTVVGGAGLTKTHRGVVDGATGVEATQKGEGVGKGLDGAAGLAGGEGEVDLAVVSGVKKIPRTNHCENLAGLGTDN